MDSDVIEPISFRFKSETAIAEKSKTPQLTLSSSSASIKGTPLQ